MGLAEIAESKDTLTMYGCQGHVPSNQFILDIHDNCSAVVGTSIEVKGKSCTCVATSLFPAALALSRKGGPGTSILEIYMHISDIYGMSYRYFIKV